MIGLQKPLISPRPVLISSKLVIKYWSACFTLSEFTKTSFLQCGLFSFSVRLNSINSHRLTPAWSKTKCKIMIKSVCWSSKWIQNYGKHKSGLWDVFPIFWNGFSSIANEMTQLISHVWTLFWKSWQRLVVVCFFLLIR